MKNLGLLFLVPFLLLGLTQTKAQINPKSIFFQLIKPIVKDTDGIDVIMYTGIFARKDNDENTYYSSQKTNTGVRFRCTLEHIENIFVYGDVFYEVLKIEDKFQQPSGWHTERGIWAEIGWGIRIPVALGNTGLSIEGQFTSPFGFFNPGLLAQIKWEHKNVSIGLGNQIIARQASIWNPVCQFEYKLLPRKK